VPVAEPREQGRRMRGILLRRQADAVSVLKQVMRGRSGHVASAMCFLTHAIYSAGTYVLRVEQFFVWNICRRFVSFLMNSARREDLKRLWLDCVVWTGTGLKETLVLVGHTRNLGCTLDLKSPGSVRSVVEFWDPCRKDLRASRNIYIWIPGWLC